MKPALSKISFLFFRYSIHICRADCVRIIKSDPILVARGSPSPILFILYEVTVYSIHMKRFSLVFSSCDLNYIPNESCFSLLSNGTVSLCDENHVKISDLSRRLIRRLYRDKIAQNGDFYWFFRKIAINPEVSFYLGRKLRTPYTILILTSHWFDWSVPTQMNKIK
jgi:hypothetical protein